MLQALQEIESDMSAFHRVDDIYTMEAAVFFRRAKCLPAYNGALWQRLRHEQSQAAQNPPAAAPVQQADDEEALWAQYRQRAYAKFLKPGEVPRQVSVSEGLALASQAFSGRR